MVIVDIHDTRFKGHDTVSSHAKNHVKFSGILGSPSFRMRLSFIFRVKYIMLAEDVLCTLYKNVPKEYKNVDKMNFPFFFAFKKICFCA